jgi:catechol 2,3-dioxygenase-like lactoylglutathione lyase family enzyme
MKFNSLIPELYVSDFAKSLHFYVDILGFKIEYDRKGPLFAFLSYGEAQLMIQEDDNNPQWQTAKLEKPYGRGINFEIRTDEIDEMVRRLRANLYELQHDVEESWRKAGSVMVGQKEMRVLDPDGYFLRFSQSLGSKPIL